MQCTSSFVREYIINLQHEARSIIKLQGDELKVSPRQLYNLFSCSLRASFEKFRLLKFRNLQYATYYTIQSRRATIYSSMLGNACYFKYKIGGCFP